MAKKQMLFKTKGMNRDLSVSAFNPEFSFENRNLRLSTNESNTLLSWVNEKGTAIVLSNNEDHDPILLVGTPIGTAVINHTLIIFTTNNHGEESQESNSDYIYKLEPTPTKEYMALTMLYNGNLNFSTEYPIETIGSYEADHIQKVYWTDGKNQPRVINIVGNIKENADTQFDFIPEVSFEGSVSITQTNNSGGIFAPGVIQYCIAYYNRYRQQSNIIYVSPLYYLGANNRGASPEDKVNVSFTLTISNPDPKFDYIRLYSVQRTSLNGTPIVKLLEDLDIRNVDENNQLKYTDYGTTGSSMDPTELLFIGGKEISVLTMTDKDGTLFMGNITEHNTPVDSLQDYFLENEANIQFETSPSWDSGIKVFNQKHTKELYPYESTLKYNQEVQSTFKGGEYYRFGFQLQKKTGEWSEPIYLNDVKNNKYPEIYSSDLEQQGTKYKLAYAKTAINFETIGIDISDYVQVRPLVVFPNIGDREVLCQGVINPTVFNVEDRLTGSPYSQASWFFRPFGLYAVTPDPSAGTEPEIATLPQSKHYASLHDYSEYSTTDDSILIEDYRFFRKACMIEVQGAVKTKEDPYDLTTPSVNSNTQFFVDQSIITLNSPDIEFDTEVQNSPMDGLKLRIVGTIPIDSSASSHSITTSSGKMPTGINLELKNGVGRVSQNYGKGELEYNTFYFNGQSMNYGTHMIAANIWNDGFAINCEGHANFWYDMTLNDPYRNYAPGIDEFEQEGDYMMSSHAHLVKFFVHPWNRNGSLSNDYRAKDSAASLLKTKRMSNILFSLNSKYLSEPIEYENISTGLHLTENDHIYKIGLPKQKERSASISYYPNIDKILNNPDGIKVIPETFTETDDRIRYSLENIDNSTHDYGMMNRKVYDPIPMKYKSTSHVVVAFNETDSKIPILPKVYYKNIGINNYSHPYGKYGQYTTFWGDQDMQFSMNGSIDVSHNNVLLLGELYYEKDSDTRFGGKGKEAFKSNTWTIGGNAVPINTQGDTTLIWSIGDTYFQRYDCLKTYAYTPEDVNQVVEILSFMCETHVNIDGRYDNNRGESTNHSMNPNNFNLLNDAYSQKDNFFSYKKSNTEDEHYRYPNWVAYSKKKESGADIDLWTNITLGSVLEFDGDKGEVQKLTKFGDQILAFQDSLLSQIMFNANVQISSTQGVPIEIANSGKVDGKRSLSDNIGCSNKWSVVNTPSGVYFMDSNNKGIYMYNGQINNLSGTLGFNTWCKKNIPSSNVKWDPYNFNNFIGHYDKLNQEILYINGSTALAYNEKLNAFTSFYDYGDTPWFCNLDDVGLWIRKDASIWQHQAGEYCNFFDENKPYGMTIVGNPEPQIDKIFTNLEFRASVEGDGELNSQTGKFTPTLPFDSLETWNEYQHGIAKLSIRNSYTHHTLDNNASLKRRFRIWRCDVPRDNAPLSGDAALGVSRVKAHPIDRMRNPWLYLKLQKDADTDKKVEIHDIVMTYFI